MAPSSALTSGGYRQPSGETALRLAYLRRLFDAHLLKVVFIDYVGGSQEHVAGRGYDAAYPQCEMTRRDFESAGEFFLAAGDFGGSLERSDVNRWHCPDSLSEVCHVVND
jgi:hypothetical protein